MLDVLTNYCLLQAEYQASLAGQKEHSDNLKSKIVQSPDRFKAVSPSCAIYFDIIDFHSFTVLCWLIDANMYNSM